MSDPPARPWASRAFIAWFVLPLVAWVTVQTLAQRALRRAA